MMTRVEELAQRFLDGSLDDAGRAELDALLADPAQLAAFTALVRLDIDLERMAPSRIDPGEAMRRIWAAEARRTHEQVVERVPTVRVARASASRRRRMARRPTPRAPWAALLVAAAALLAVTVGLVLTREAAPADPAGRYAVTAGERILVWADGTRVRLVAPVELEVDPDAGAGTRLRLAHGRIEAQVARQPPERRFAVGTPAAQVTVVGTAFSVEHRGDVTAVAVDQGVVACRALAGGDEEPVVAGGRWRSDAAPAAPGGPVPAPAASSSALRFEIVDPTTGEPMPGYAPLRDGAVLPFTARNGVPVALRLRTEPPAVGVVRFDLVQPGGRTTSHDERKPPYYVFRDRPEGEVIPRFLPPGSWRVTATVLDREGRLTAATTTIAFTVEDPR